MPAGVGQGERGESVPRPDRSGKVAMTTRVTPRLRQIYKILAAQLGTTMEEMQIVALRSFIANFRKGADRRAVWETIRREFAEGDQITDSK